jgi:hypothetical protein
MAQAATAVSAIIAERVTISNVVNILMSRARLPNHPRDSRSPDSIHGVHGKVIEWLEWMILRFAQRSIRKNKWHEVGSHAAGIKFRMSRSP